jgi:hypothetical protein
MKSRKSPKSVSFSEMIGERGVAATAWRVLSPSRDGARDDGPLVAVDGVRREDLPVLLLGERPALDRWVQLIAPPVCFFVESNGGGLAKVVRKEITTSPKRRCAGRRGTGRRARTHKQT